MKEFGETAVRAVAPDERVDSPMPHNAGGNDSRLVKLSTHPIVVTLFGFICTGVVGTYLTWSLNSNEHSHDTEATVRNSAINAVSDISDLTNERRTRGKMVVSAILRAAPEAEVLARKNAYDEAYVRWNAKVPGDLLRIRAGLHWSPSGYERYVDALTDANFLSSAIPDSLPLRPTSVAPNPGLFSIMDSCLTKAFDNYRANKFVLSPQVSDPLSACRFSEVSAKSIDCFAAIAEKLYIAVNKTSGADSVSDKALIDTCKPPQAGG